MELFLKVFNPFRQHMVWNSGYSFSDDFLEFFEVSRMMLKTSALRYPNEKQLQRLKLEEQRDHVFPLMISNDQKHFLKNGAKITGYINCDSIQLKLEGIDIEFFIFWA